MQTRRREPRYKKGERIGGQYLVHQALMGGMGEVYLCLDEENNYPFALKTFQGGNAGLKTLFDEEVASWIALEKHPNIVRLHATQVLDSIPFMMLEWVAGEPSRGADLRGWLQRGALDLPLALRFTIDIVRGLQHANEKSPGIVHRDRKPDNVLVNQSKQAKITDFGLARVAQRGDLELGDDEGQEALGHSMRVGSVVGTPQYMPPEQWHGELNLDFRTDIYAVGCIFYELLTGNRPYAGFTLTDLRDQHLDAPIPALPDALPPEATTILTGCMAKDVNGRYATLDKLFEDLKTLYEQHSDEPLPEVQAGEFTAVDFNNRGASYGDLRQHQRAIQDYNQAIQLDPKYATAYSNRGNSYADLGQHQQAIADYDRAIQLDPNLKEAYFSRGYIYTDLGQHQRAIADFDRAIHLDPNYAAAYVNRGNIYGDLGQHQRAIGDYDRAIQLDPNLKEAYFNRGNSYDEIGQHQHAIQDFNRAIQLDPNYVAAYVNRGNIYGAVGHYERAIRDFDRAIQLDPNYAIAYLNKAVALAQSGRLQEAVEWGQQAAQRGAPHANEFINMVHQMMGQAPQQTNTGDPQAAFEAFQQAGSMEAMRQAVQQHPVLAQMIPTIRQVIDQQVPAEHQPYFEERLGWLRGIVGE